MSSSVEELAAQYAQKRGSLEAADWEISRKLSRACAELLAEAGLKKHGIEARVTLYPAKEQK